MNHDIYFTIRLSYVEPTKATKWHPTDYEGPFATLTRGAFQYEDTAHAWAEKHIPGHTYEVCAVDPRDNSVRSLGTFRANDPR